VPWVWEEENQLYRNTETGEILTYEQVLDLIDEIVDDMQDEVSDTLTDMLADGRLTVVEWEQNKSSMLRGLFAMLFLLGIGLAIPTEEEWGVLEAALRVQFDYLSSFARQIAREELSIADIRRRSRMYVNSVRQAFWLGWKVRVSREGKTEELWHTRGDTDVCSPCNEAEGLNWVPLGTLGEPGSGDVVLWPEHTTCRGLVSCRCWKEAR